MTTSRRPARRAGSAYIMVLGTTMLVTLLGIAGLTALRLDRAAHEAGGETERAAALADSALELALTVTQETDWRTDLDSGEWSERLALGGGEIRYRFTDADGDLEDDEFEPATIEGEGIFGPSATPRTRRRASVRIDPSLRRDGGSGSIVRNGTMNSINNWSASLVGAVEMEQRLDGGNYYLRVKNRTAAEYGASQSLSGRLTERGTYDVAFRASMHSRPSDTITLKLVVRTVDGVRREFPVSRALSTSWGEFTEELNLAWTGEVQNASLEAVTASNDDFYLDDVSIRLRSEGPAPVVPGSWRQVVLAAGAATED